MIDHLVIQETLKLDVWENCKLKVKTNVLNSKVYCKIKYMCNYILDVQFCYIKNQNLTFIINWANLFVPRKFTLLNFSSVCLCILKLEIYLVNLYFRPSYLIKENRNIKKWNCSFASMNTDLIYSIIQTQWSCIIFKFTKL